MYFLFPRLQLFYNCRNSIWLTTLGKPLGVQVTSPGWWGTWRNPVEYTTDYFWVVVCKNHRVHHKGNIGYEHRILLGETDAFEALPMLPETVKIRCDNCDEEYSYKRKEVLRDEVQVPENFVPHHRRSNRYRFWRCGVHIREAKDCSVVRTGTRGWILTRSCIRTCF